MPDTLYRKYRSKKFEEVIGQEHIVSTLVNSIKNKSFAHAYLLTGPRGVGKTSVARLFAYKVNGLDYDEEETYSDIVEIDAASNRRIDEIRDLREKINIAPSSLKYKVYIIDEVHMLTKEAFNALLKTLEEPPEHAIFVLATTDNHKVPDTISSRCVNFAFAPITDSDIKKHLDNISKQESMNIEDKALDLIAVSAGGSFRDGLSLLDQFRNSGQEIITEEYVSRIIGLPPADLISEVLDALMSSKPKDLLDSLDRLRSFGATESQIAWQIVVQLRTRLIEDKLSAEDGDKLAQLSEDLLRLGEYSNQKMALEIMLLKRLEKEAIHDEHEAESITESQIHEAKNEELSQETKDKPIDKALDAKSDSELWEQTLGRLKENNRTLYGVARMAEVKHAGDSLELYLKFPFHYKQLKSEKNLQTLRDIINSITGKTLDIKVLMNNQTEASDKSLSNISNIFGPSEVLES